MVPNSTRGLYVSFGVRCFVGARRAGAGITCCERTDEVAIPNAGRRERSIARSKCRPVELADYGSLELITDLPGR